MPDVGEGLTEAEIVAWHVSVGDTVAVNQVLVEIETAKSIVELPSPFAGTVIALYASTGETVPVGDVIIEIGDPDAASAADTTGATDDSSAAAGSEESATTTEETVEAEAPKLLVGYGASDPGQSRRRRGAGRTAGGGTPTVSAVAASAGNTTAAVETSTADSQGPTSSAQAAAAVQGETALGAQAGEKPRAKPPVRGLAKQLGVDLTLVEATGPNGTVSREDVRRASSGNTSATGPETPAIAALQDANTEPISAAPIARTPGSATDVKATRIPIKGVRKATAAAMVASAFTAPHVTEFVTIDVTASLELLAEVQRRREFAEIKVTPLALVARAYLRAISRTPMATAHWDEAAQEIVLPSSVNLGIAAATPRGLLVPNIKGAGSLDLAELATAIRELAATARAGMTPPADLAGGSTTITNIGVFGIDTGTPILNPGETAILAVGAIQRRPWVVGTGDNERIEPRSVMQLALSFDHRVLDGAEGSRLLADTAEILANPGLAML
ncbi:MAG: 2-oxo acid dehydrogenase subunit E2 [Actinomycetales bacterium]|nr:2-oxo acid dehydrogenase subunit E2 [Actinomycetales bacterium]